MKEEERIKYLSKEYFKGTITKEEWEEVLWRLDRAEEPGNIDELFRREWLREGQPHTIPHVTWEHINGRRNSGKSRSRQGKVIFSWKWAAAASVLALISAIWWVWSADHNLLTYETGFGETQEILLDDGTAVTLNANSRLIWDKGWENSGVRLAEIDGEAYFDVSHIETTKGNLELLPFQVKTSDLMVNVLGTAFNVSDRRGETDVFLERGLVKLVLGDGQKSENIITLKEDGKESLERITTDEVMMKPGDHVSFSTVTKVLKKGGDKKYVDDLTWKNGTLAYRKMEFGKILTELEDIYGKRFEVEDSVLLNRKVSLAVPYENWETVYKLIEVTLNLEIIENSENNIIKIRKRTG